MLEYQRRLVFGRPPGRKVHAWRGRRGAPAANAGAEMLRRGGTLSPSPQRRRRERRRTVYVGLGRRAATFFKADTGEVSRLDFIPPAPPDKPASYGLQTAETGPLSPCTPGSLAGWYGLQSRYGNSFSDVLQPAIKLRRTGIRYRNSLSPRRLTMPGALRIRNGIVCFGPKRMEARRHFKARTSRAHWARLPTRGLAIFTVVNWATSSQRTWPGRVIAMSDRKPSIQTRRRR